MTMANALDRMLERTGKTRADYVPNSKMGNVFAKRGVEDSPELQRVLYLPRRRWQDDTGLEQLVRDMTEWLRTPDGTMTLRPLQAKGLEELHDFGGLIAPVRVGGGKTLLSFLAAIVVGARAALLLVPAKLRDKTLREFRVLEKHWIRHPKLRVLSYETLSRDGGLAKIMRLDPDLIIADEDHKLKNLGAGCTRKLRRWFREHPDCRYVGMSGTMTTRSLREYAHRVRWALRNNAPLPKNPQLEDWADAIDEKLPPTRRLMPGALLGLCSDEELDTVARDRTEALRTVRKAYRRRLVETPGVVATDEAALGVSLSIIDAGFDIKGAANREFEILRDNWEVPGGEPFTEAIDLWRHCRELACGFIYKWDPPAPQDWIEARRAWSRFVREMLGRRFKGIDTEFQVARACTTGKFDRSLYDAWKAIKPTFIPNTIPVWIHTRALEFAAKWLRREGGICWVEHKAFGNRLAEETGLPYFAQGGVCDGRPIEEASGPVIASIASNAEGRNLQKWNKNLVTSPPPNGRIWEQKLGRTHREGQEADDVSCEVMVACKEQWEGLQQAILDAQYIQDTTGQPQKLLYADVALPSAGDVVSRALEPAWA